MSNRQEPPNDDYKGPIGECAICETPIELENIHDEHKYIDGLGDLCLNCYLKEVELGAV